MKDVKDAEWYLEPLRGSGWLMGLSGLPLFRFPLQGLLQICKPVRETELTSGQHFYPMKFLCALHWGAKLSHLL